MREIRRPGGGPARTVGLLVLGASTLWLVVQNTALFLAAWWSDPGTVGVVATALIKATALVIARFWSSPAAIALVAAALTALALRAKPARAEVRHG